MKNIIALSIIIIQLNGFAQSGYLINTLAGGPGFAGDGGVCDTARFASPRGIAIDKSGNLYIGDHNNGRVRRINLLTKIITTVAGNGGIGFAGDGGQALSASFITCQWVCTDTSGNFYIADQQANRIRKVDIQTGIITTVAGSAWQGFAGDGGPATSAALYWPQGMVVDKNNDIYISDTYNHRIRKVTAATGVINTIAGTGTASYNGDGIPATSAYLYYPCGIILDSVGNIYFSDGYNRRVRYIDTITGYIHTIAGNGTTVSNPGDNGPALNASVWSPYGIAFDSTFSNLFITDRGHHSVRKVDLSTGIISKIAGTGVSGFSGDGGPADSAMITEPYGIAVGPQGEIYISDIFNNRIRKIYKDSILDYDLNEFHEENILFWPNPADQELTVAVDQTSELKVFDLSGNKIRTEIIIDGKRYSINTRQLANGIYFLHVSNEKSLAVKKIVVQHE